MEATEVNKGNGEKLKVMILATERDPVFPMPRLLHTSQIAAVRQHKPKEKYENRIVQEKTLKTLIYAAG